jgi:hypothetical protein
MRAHRDANQGQRPDNTLTTNRQRLYMLCLEPLPGVATANIATAIAADVPAESGTKELLTDHPLTVILLT